MGINGRPNLTFTALLSATFKLIFQHCFRRSILLPNYPTLIPQISISPQHFHYQLSKLIELFSLHQSPQTTLYIIFHARSQKALDNNSEKSMLSTYIIQKEHERMIETDNSIQSFPSTRANSTSFSAGKYSGSGMGSFE
jgi:hypothetical protein